MVRRFLFLVLAVTLTSCLFSHAEEGSVAVFAVSEEEGKFRSLTSGVPPAEGLKILAKVAGPERSHLLVVPFFAKSPMIRSAPMLRKQGEGEPTLTYPSPKWQEGVSHVPGGSSFELYVFCFPEGNPEFPSVAETVRLLKEALSQKKDEVAQLYGLELREKLTALVRQSSGVVSSGGFGDLELQIRSAPAAKAAVSRTGTASGESAPSAAIENDEAYSTLEEAWENSRASLQTGLVSPGAKVFSFPSSESP